jgi:hypothetical protein
VVFSTFAIGDFCNVAGADPNNGDTMCSGISEVSNEKFKGLVLFCFISYYKSLASLNIKYSPRLQFNGGESISSIVDEKSVTCILFTSVRLPILSID